MKVHGDSDYLDFCRNKFCAKDHEHEVLNGKVRLKIQN